MKAIAKQIPNLLTLSNLLCGCLAIKFAFEWDLIMAAYLVGLASIFDFLDGFAARLLKVSGEMGKQLDSLADLVSFGVVPGVVMFQMMRIVSLEIPYEFPGNTTIIELAHHSSKNISMSNYTHPLSYLAFLICLFSAYRLAKFNIDTRQSDKFIGLPTPANAIFICSIGWIFSQYIGFDLKEINNLQQLYQPGSWGLNRIDLFTLYEYPRFHSTTEYTSHFLYNLIDRNNLYLILICITCIFSYLLIAEIPLFALKFKNFGWSDNKIRYIFLTISLAMLIIFHLLAIPFIVILYILLSIVNNLIFKP